MACLLLNEICPGRWKLLGNDLVLVLLPLLHDGYFLESGNMNHSSLLRCLFPYIIATVLLLHVYKVNEMPMFLVSLSGVPQTASWHLAADTLCFMQSFSMGNSYSGHELLGLEFNYSSLGWSVRLHSRVIHSFRPEVVLFPHVLGLWK